MSFDGQYYEKTVKPYASSPFWAVEAGIILGMVGSESANRSILDFGCSDGGLADLARQLLEPESVVGVDVDGYALAEAKKRHAWLSVSRYDGLRLPWPDFKFDIVTCLNTLGHVIDPVVSLGEIHRVLRHGGSLALIIPNQAYYDRMGADAGPGDATIKHTWTHETISPFLARNGFDVIYQEQFGNGLPDIEYLRARIGVKLRRW